MRVLFYLAGETTPLLYHYFMRLDGTLAEQDDQPKTPGLMMIVCERGDTVLTAKQENALKLMKEARPDWEHQFFFQRSK